MPRRDFHSDTTVSPTKKLECLYDRRIAICSEVRRLAACCSHQCKLGAGCCRAGSRVGGGGRWHNPVAAKRMEGVKEAGTASEVVGREADCSRAQPTHTKAEGRPTPPFQQAQKQRQRFSMCTVMQTRAADYQSWAAGTCNCRAPPFTLR